MAAGEAIVGSLPDVARLLLRLCRDPRVPMRYRASLLGMAAYLLSPIDVIPDFIPVVGAMDDSLLVALVLRWAVRGIDQEVLEDHWEGSPEVLDLIGGLAGRTDRPTGPSAQK